MPSNREGTDAANGARLEWVCFVTHTGTVGVVQANVWGQFYLEIFLQGIVGKWHKSGCKLYL